MDKGKLLEIVNASGIPFQLRIEHEIRATRDQHSWDVVGHEVPWRDSLNDQSGFADLVLEQGNMRIVVECKRPDHQTPYLFLAPHSRATVGPTKRCMVCWAKAGAGGPAYQEWAWEEVGPASPEVSFAVVNKTDKARPLLERLASDLTAATQAISWAENETRQTGEHHRFSMAFSMLVTAAPLYVCHYPHPNTTIMGVLSDAEFDEVQSLRFSKSLSTDPRFPQEARSLSALIAAQERTIFIVNVGHLIDLLRAWNVEGGYMSPTVRKFVIPG